MSRLAVRLHNYKTKRTKVSKTKPDSYREIYIQFVRSNYCQVNVSSNSKEPCQHYKQHFGVSVPQLTKGLMTCCQGYMIASFLPEYMVHVTARHYFLAMSQALLKTRTMTCCCLYNIIQLSVCQVYFTGPYFTA